MCFVVEKYLSMPLDEKRKHYRSSTFYTVDKITTWQDYFLKSKERLKMQCKLFMYVCMYYYMCSVNFLCFEETLLEDNLYRPACKSELVSNFKLSYFVM